MDDMRSKTIRKETFVEKRVAGLMSCVNFMNVFILRIINKGYLKERMNVGYNLKHFENKIWK